jgi:hypothetical protein
VSFYNAFLCLSNIICCAIFWKPFICYIILLPCNTHCNWWHRCCWLNHWNRCLKYSLLTLVNHWKLNSSLVDHIVYSSCLHLETTAQVISQDASNLRSVVMSIKVMYTHIYVSHTRTHTHSIHSHICTHQELQFCCIKNFCGILKLFVQISCFANFHFILKLQRLHFSKLQKSWKRSKVLNNTDYILCCFFVNMTVCYAVINFKHAKSFHRERCSSFLSHIFRLQNLYLYLKLRYQKLYH